MAFLFDLLGQSLNTQTILVFLLVSVIAWSLWKIFGSPAPSNLPPGPFSLPIVGTIPFLGLDVREPLRKLSDKYGDIFTIYLGTRRVIILNSYEAIKEAFVKNGHALAGRPQDLLFVREIQRGLGVVSSQGELWRENRKLSHTILRDLGVGNSFMEDRIREEAVHLQKYITDHLKGPCDPSYIIQASIANIIYSVVFGARRQYDDPEFVYYIKIMNESFEVVGNSGPLTVFPFLRYIPGDLFHFKRLMESVVYMHGQYTNYVAEHQRTYTPGVIRDFIDAYIKVMREEEEKGNETTLSDEQLARLVGDLFGAGTETTTSTLRWGIVYLLRCPDIQRKAQKEIDDVIGKQVPKMAHRQKMPYIEACLHEIQRLGDIVPLGVPHTTLEDVQLGDYIIPTGTTVMSNLYSVHYDPKLWPDPYKFDPARFLDADGKLHRKEKLIPFSMGKRVCLGESLARMELFLFFTIMLQNFTFRLPDGEPLPDQCGFVGITHQPKDFKVLIEPRS